MSRIWRDLGQLSNLTMNISGNRSGYRKKETNFVESNPCSIGQKNLVNFGPLTKKL